MKKNNDLEDKVEHCKTGVTNHRTDYKGTIYCGLLTPDTASECQYSGKPIEIDGMQVNPCWYKPPKNLRK